MRMLVGLPTRRGRRDPDRCRTTRHHHSMPTAIEVSGSGLPVYRSAMGTVCPRMAPGAKER